MWMRGNHSFKYKQLDFHFIYIYHSPHLPLVHSPLSTSPALQSLHTYIHSPLVSIMSNRLNQLLLASAAVAAPSLTGATYSTGSTWNGSQPSICSIIPTVLSSASTVLSQSNSTATEIEEVTHHWFGSSSQTSACVVTPATAQDVSLLMQLIAAMQSPFAIYSGGHASNAGFSSTTGVHISLSNFDQATLSADNSTVEIGFGQIWSQVLNKLDGTGYGVVGGRTNGPGIGGFTLGGGYSWKTNQFGLTCDSIKSFNLVLPVSFQLAT